MKRTFGRNYYIVKGRKYCAVDIMPVSRLLRRFSRPRSGRVSTCRGRYLQASEAIARCRWRPACEGATPQAAQRRLPYQPPQPHTRPLLPSPSLSATFVWALQSADTCRRRQSGLMAVNSLRLAMLDARHRLSSFTRLLRASRNTPRLLYIKHDKYHITQHEYGRRVALHLSVTIVPWTT